MVRRGKYSATSSTDDRHLADEAAALSEQAQRVIAKPKRRGIALATSESCTGEPLASLLTDHDGFRQSFERGFVTYTNEANSALLGVEWIEIAPHGAVCAELAVAMAQGALARSKADMALAITGFAGPEAPKDEAGLVHLTCAGPGALWSSANATSASWAASAYANSLSSAHSR